MAETITLSSLILSGQTLTMYLRKSDGTLLNTGGGLMTEVGTTGVFTATLVESRTGLGPLAVRGCTGSEIASNSLYEGWLSEGSITIDAATNLSSAQVNAEMLDVFTIDTFAELSVPPTATSSLKDKLTWMFMWFRNKSTETATQRKLYADNTTTVVSTEGVTDDGTTFIKDEAS